MLAEQLYKQILYMPEAVSLLDKFAALEEPILTNRSHPTMSTFASKVFELLAWQKACQIFPESHVLSPSTFDGLLEYLYSTRSRQGGISGVVFCDGIVIKPGSNNHYSITDLLEFKSSYDPTLHRRFIGQLSYFVQYDRVASLFDLHDTYGREQFAHILHEVNPRLNPSTVSLARNYQVEYFTPARSRLSRDLILDKPYNYFLPPGRRGWQSKGISLRPQVNSRLKVKPCDFTGQDLSRLMTILSEEVIRDRRGRTSLSF